MNHEKWCALGDDLGRAEFECVPMVIGWENWEFWWTVNSKVEVSCIWIGKDSGVQLFFFKLDWDVKKNKWEDAIGMCEGGSRKCDEFWSYAIFFMLKQNSTTMFSIKPICTNKVYTKIFYQYGWNGKCKTIPNKKIKIDGLFFQMYS